MASFPFASSRNWGNQEMLRNASSPWKGYKTSFLYSSSRNWPKYFKPLNSTKMVRSLTAFPFSQGARYQFALCWRRRKYTAKYLFDNRHALCCVIGQHALIQVGSTYLAYENSRRDQGRWWLRLKVEDTLCDHSDHRDAGVLHDDSCILTFCKKSKNVLAVKWNKEQPATVLQTVEEYEHVSRQSQFKLVHTYVRVDANLMH